MTTYGQFCPVAKAAEIFAERWTPLIVRELDCGSHRFAELERGLPRISRALLVQRLRALERAGVIERRALEGGRVSEYHLTDAGRELADVTIALGIWGQRWANAELRQSDIDPDLLMWDVHRRIHLDRVPDQRVVVRFDFTGAYTRSYWLVLEHGGSSVCFGDPAFDDDLLVTVDTAVFHQIWIGRLAIESAVEDGRMRVDGPPALARAFPGWLALSVFAGHEPARL